MLVSRKILRSIRASTIAYGSCRFKDDANGRDCPLCHPAYHSTHRRHIRPKSEPWQRWASKPKISLFRSSEKLSMGRLSSGNRLWRPRVRPALNRVRSVLPTRRCFRQRHGSVWCRRMATISFAWLAAILVPRAVLRPFVILFSGAVMHGFDLAWSVIGVARRRKQDSMLTCAALLVGCRNRARLANASPA